MVLELERDPLSWLLLERYALGELSSEERARVEARLALSAEDRACLTSILDDRSELPPLPQLPRSLGEARAKRRRLSLFGASLAAAAALAIAALPQSERGSLSRRRVERGEKGGEVALTLHGEQSGAHATHFAEAERFKLLVTCPSWFHEPLRVVVFQGGERFEPLVARTQPSCGNQVPWPGAFALSGDEPVDVCVSWHQEQAQATSASDLGERAVCTRLEPLLAR